MRLPALALTLLLSAVSVPALASGEHAGHGAAAPVTSENAYAEVMTKMHQAMPMESSGNADVDFIKGMIPHHQGAIDMAEIALQKSTDPFVRKLAEDIIAAQKSEIAAMQNWLTEHEKSAD